jgi:protein phosphatase PTC7
MVTAKHVRDITYRVKVSTGDYRGAGTGANISLQLFGNRGKSPLIELTEEDLLHSIETSKQGSHSDEWTLSTSDQAKRPELVQRNTTQTFNFEVPRELGELKSLQIGHDNEGLGSGWFLSNVVVESDEVVVDDEDDTPMTASFLCNKWLGDSDSGVGMGGPTTRVLVRSAAMGGSDYVSEREISRSALTAGGPGLKLCTSAVAVPHADKVRDGARGVNKRSFGHAGDDAYFVGGEKAIGVADGVGQWREKGIDSGEFSRALMQSCLQSSTSAFSERKSASSLLVSAAASVSSDKTLGSSTACVLTLDQSTGVASIANLGDSGVLIGRWADGGVSRSGEKVDAGPRVVFRSPQQEHEFGYPFQLGHHEHADHPSTAQMFDAVLEAGDIVIMGSDGVFDNLTDYELLQDAFEHVHKHHGQQQLDEEGGGSDRGSSSGGGGGGGNGGNGGNGAATGLSGWSKYPIRQTSSSTLRKVASDIASSLADKSFWKSVDKSADTPFSMSASEAFDVVYNGGKKDDITIICSVVAPNVTMSSGKNYDEHDQEDFYFQG